MILAPLVYGWYRSPSGECKKIRGVCDQAEIDYQFTWAVLALYTHNRLLCPRLPEKTGHVGSG
jgi:hypothetical protein